MKVAFVTALVLSGIVLSPDLLSSGEAYSSTSQDDHGIGDPKIEYRLRMARADARQEKMHDAADEIGRLTVELAERVSRSGSLSRDDAKDLDRIRKLAKRLRSDLGGGGDEVLSEMPSTVRDAAASLGASGAEFAKLFSRSSRFVVDARVIKKAGELVVLAEYLKTFAR